MKKMIEINDTLDERVATAKAEMQEAISEVYKQANPKTLDALFEVREALMDNCFEIADSNTPIYTSEIEDIFYLHGADIETAFDDHGIGEKLDKDFPAGWKAAAIACYIQDQLSEVIESWYSERETELSALLKKAERVA